MNINEYLKGNKNFLAPAIVCANGFKMSVQASAGHYCSPRNDVGPWASVEVGFPSAKCEELMPYAENAEEPCDTVYGYVPVEVVEQVIANNGGFSHPDTRN